MLVLSRRRDESIVIDGTICITILSMKGGKVRLGIKAPPGVRVDRVEVHERRRLAPKSSVLSSKR